MLAMGKRDKKRGKWLLELEGTELLVYDLPDYLIGGHDREFWKLQRLSEECSKTLSCRFRSSNNQEVCAEFYRSFAEIITAKTAVRKV